MKELKRFALWMDDNLIFTDNEIESIFNYVMDNIYSLDKVMGDLSKTQVYDNNSGEYLNGWEINWYSYEKESSVFLFTIQ